MCITTPIAFIIFNRPDFTEIVFEAIRQAKPKKLLVVADGSRPDRPGEAEKCAAARSIIERVDWDCEVLKNYSDTNLGCGLRPATGISWVFEQVEEAIFLEDDCLPHPSFFLFCQELLERYRDDERIMLVGGTNHFGEWKSPIQSYHFSQFSGIWGWASWRRAWKFYDYDMKLFPEALETNFLNNIFSNPKHLLYWKNQFQRVFDDRNKTYWDYQWLLTRWIQNGLGIIPSVNLVSNIGFGVDATHTFGDDNPLANLDLKELTFPLKHPPFLIRNIELDNLIQDKFCTAEVSDSFQSRIVKIAKKIINQTSNSFKIYNVNHK